MAHPAAADHRISVERLSQPDEQRQVVALMALLERGSKQTAGTQPEREEART